MDLLKRIIESGQNPKDLLRHNLIMRLGTDLIDRGSTDEEGMLKQAGLYQHGPKKELKSVTEPTRKHVRKFDDACSEPDTQERWGLIADEIYEFALNKLIEYGH